MGDFGLVSDDAFGRDGEPFSLKILVCENFRKELASVLAGGRYSDIGVTELPSFCDHPLREHEGEGKEAESLLAWQTALVSASGDAGKTNVFIGCHRGVSADNGAGHCLALLAGKSLIASLESSGACVVIPAWLRRWNERIDDPSFDGAAARSSLRERFSRVVLLDTGTDGDSSEFLRKISAYLDIPSETLHVGLDCFRLTVENEISSALRLAAEREMEAAKRQLARKDADSMMTLDLLESLADKKTERDVMLGLFDLLSMLFSSSALVFVPNGDSPAIVQQRDEEGKKLVPEMTEWMRSADQQWKISDDGSSFYIRIARGETRFGVIGASGFEFPRYVKRYFARAKNIAGICGFILENQRLRKNMEHVANVDNLTGLWNRAHFYATGLREMARANRYGTTLTAIMFDLDFFKSVNDTYGNAAGDHVLRSVSDCARAQMRETDICGRLGSGEFAVLLPETSVDQAFVFAERLRGAVEGLQIFWEEKRIAVTFSAGLSQAYSIGVTDEMSFDMLLSRCDEALYAAKKKGRNRCELYRPPSEKSAS